MLAGIIFSAGGFSVLVLLFTVSMQHKQNGELLPFRISQYTAQRELNGEAAELGRDCELVAGCLAG
jgi:hypothetical protein